LRLGLATSLAPLMMVVVEDLVKVKEIVLVVDLLGLARAS
jgi:hypothetical protein